MLADAGHRLTAYHVSEGRCCIKAKDALAMPQRGEADPSGVLETVINRASEDLVRRFLGGQ